VRLSWPSRIESPCSCTRSYPREAMRYAWKRNKTAFTSGSSVGDETMLQQEQVLEALRDVYDPELGYNIVDLGLVYGVVVRDETIEITMTMTTPGCPASSYIQEGVRERLLSMKGVQDVDIHVVWSPPWTPEMMSEDAKQYFGFA
jgi:metal-sulfur cluster biosynthetic enzyme